MPEQVEQSTIPPWHNWTEVDTETYLDSLRDNGDLTLCECCNDVFLFRDATSYRPGADTAVETDVVHRWLNPTLGVSSSRATLIRVAYASSYDYTTDWYRGVEYEYISESYDYICNSCHENRSEDNDEARDDYSSDDDESSSYVHDYSYRPSPLFFSVVSGDDGEFHFNYSRNARLADRNKLSPASWGAASTVQIPYCGIELEMSRERSSLSVDSAARHLTDVCRDFAYMKWDGSVSNGFELVTHPHTLEAWDMRESLWSALTYLGEKGWRSWNSSSSCGLHIHINNASFHSVGHAMRFLKFIFSNREPLVRFAGRDSSYARFNYDEFVMRQYHSGYDDDGNPVYERYSLGDVVKKKVVNDNRYLAVNAQGRHTFELRFFRGNMNPLAVRACLEFVYALHEYSKDLTSHDCVARNALTWRPFLAFISRKSGESNFQYRRLYDRLTLARRNGDNGFLNTGGAE